MSNLPKKLPKVTEVLGLRLQGDSVFLQYRSEDQLYDIEFSLDQIFKADDWFTMLRRQLGKKMIEFSLQKK